MELQHETNNIGTNKNPPKNPNRNSDKLNLKSTTEPKNTRNIQIRTDLNLVKQSNNFAFIDCQNLWTNKDRSWHLDWSRFRDYLKQDCLVSRAYIFIGFVNGYQKMYQQMQEAGFILIFKPIQESNGRIICNIDTEMVLQTMIQFSNFDRAVIVTGDGDFTCLVDHLRVSGKLERLILPDHSYSQALEKCAREKAEFTSSIKHLISKESSKESIVEESEYEMPMIISE